MFKSNSLVDNGMPVVARKDGSVYKSLRVALLGWLHWIMVLFFVVAWYMRGQRSGGDVLWYYVIGFVPVWAGAAVAVMCAYLKDRGKADEDKVRPVAFLLAAIGLTSPVLLLM